MLIFLFKALDAIFINFNGESSDVWRINSSIWLNEDEISR